MGSLKPQQYKSDRTGVGTAKTERRGDSPRRVGTAQMGTEQPVGGRDGMRDTMGPARRRGIAIAIGMGREVTTRDEIGRETRTPGDTAIRTGGDIGMRGGAGAEVRLDGGTVRWTPGGETATGIGGATIETTETEGDEQA